MTPNPTLDSQPQLSTLTQTNQTRVATMFLVNPERKP